MGAQRVTPQRLHAACARVLRLDVVVLLGGLQPGPPERERERARRQQRGLAGRHQRDEHRAAQALQVLRQVAAEELYLLLEWAQRQQLVLGVEALRRESASHILISCSALHAFSCQFVAEAARAFLLPLDIALVANVLSAPDKKTEQARAGFSGGTLWSRQQGVRGAPVLLS